MLNVQLVSWQERKTRQYVLSLSLDPAFVLILALLPTIMLSP